MRELRPSASADDSRLRDAVLASTYRGRLHWIIYKDAVIALAFSGALTVIATNGNWMQPEQTL